MNECFVDSLDNTSVDNEMLDNNEYFKQSLNGLIIRILSLRRLLSVFRIEHVTYGSATDANLDWKEFYIFSLSSISEGLHEASTGSREAKFDISNIYIFTKSNLAPLLPAYELVVLFTLLFEP